MTRLAAPSGIAKRKCTPTCKAYRAGVRRALAEIIIMQGEAKERIEAAPDRPMLQWHRRVRACQVIATRINDIIYRSCECGARKPRRLKRAMWENEPPIHDDDAALESELEPVALRILGAVDAHFTRSRTIAR